MTVRRVLMAALLAPLLLLACAGPLLVTADPFQQDLAASLAPPCGEWLLGADELGRSVLARAVHAAKISAGLGVLCVGLAWGLGIAAGLWTAWRGGLVEQAVLRGCDTLMAFPGLLLTLLVAGLLGGSVPALVIAVALPQWPQAVRVSRSLAAGVVILPYVQAAKLAGIGSLRILARDVLPPMLPQLLTQAALSVAHAVLTIAALGFLGLGLPPPTPEWGTMVAEATPFLAEAPWMAAVPACLLVATVLGLTLLAEEAAAA